jgi:hypothetical protein
MAVMDVGPMPWSVTSAIASSYSGLSLATEKEITMQKLVTGGVGAFLALVIASALIGPVSRAEMPPSEVGRWAVVPAQNHRMPPSMEYWNAWRLDTKTGDLEFCGYVAGGEDAVGPDGLISKQSLTCSKPVKASPSSN